MVSYSMSGDLQPSNTGDLERDARREHLVILRLSFPALLLVLILMVAPISWLLSQSVVNADGTLGLENYTRIWTEGAYVDIFIDTFKISVIVTGLCILLGYPVSYTMTILPPRLMQLAMLMVLLPFWTSLLVRTYAWMVLLQRRGIVNSALEALGLISQPLPLMYNTGGVVIGMVHIMLPFLILPLYASMQAVDQNLIRAATNLGSSNTSAFFRVFLPLTAPGLIAGSMLVFVMCLGFYITPALLGGGRVQMIAQRIETSVALYPTWGPAAALAVVLLILTAVFLGFSWLIVRRISVRT